MSVSRKINRSTQLSRHLDRRKLEIPAEIVRTLKQIGFSDAEICLWSDVLFAHKWICKNMKPFIVGRESAPKQCFVLNSLRMSARFKYSYRTTRFRQVLDKLVASGVCHRPRRSFSANKIGRPTIVCVVNTAFTHLSGEPVENMHKRWLVDLCKPLPSLCERCKNEIG